MAKRSIEESTLTNIANAIRAKTGGTAKITPETMDEALNGIPTQAAKTVTPSTADQTAVAKGVFTTGAVTVKGDANLKAENIAEGVSIFGVVGSHKGGAGTVRISVLPADGACVAWLDENGTPQTARNLSSAISINALFGVVVGTGRGLDGVTGNYENYSNTGTWQLYIYKFLEDGGYFSVTARSEK